MTDLGELHRRRRQREARKGPEGGLRSPRRQARPQRRRHRCRHREGRAVLRRRPLLGRRHGRHPLRAFPRRRRAAQHLRQARRLRGDPPADPRDAERVAAYPVGQGRRSAATQGPWRCAGPRLRCHELQHLLRRARAGAELQIRFARATPTRQRAAQAIEHNIECIEIGQAIGSKALTVWIGDGSNFPGQTQLHEELRALSRLP